MNPNRAIAWLSERRLASAKKDFSEKDWALLNKIVSRNTRGLSLDEYSVPRLRELIGKELLTKLAPRMKLNEKTAYMCGSVYVRSMVRSRSMEDEPNPDVVLGDISRFALEDLINRISEEASNLKIGSIDMVIFPNVQLLISAV